MSEVATLRRWKELRTEIIEPFSAEQGGHVVDLAGDGVLLEFPSAANSVRWAVDVQRALNSRYAAEDPERLSLRIGINVEDVIDDDGVLQGDGVNVASRIHQAAEPGQIVITAPVHDYVASRLPLRFRDLGTPHLKNISRLVRVFAVEWSDTASIGAVRQPLFQWSTRPTLAVLPFRNIGGTDTDTYFGDGITEDIIAGISQSRTLYVIARNSTLKYRGRSNDLRQIADELGVRYVLDGSVRRSGQRLRITTELTDVAANRPVWGERYDGAGEDVFEFQDRIAASIVGSLEPRVQAVEAARVRSRPTESLDAYDCVLMTLSQLYRFTDESFQETDVLLRRAIALDPGYAQAHAYVARRLNFLVGEGRSADPEADRVHGLEAARTAIALDPDDAFAVAVAGHVTSFFGGKPDEATELFEAALRLNENSAFAWALSALTLAYLGRPDEALERIRNAWRLSPFDPLNFYFWIIAGLIEFTAGRYVESVAWLRRSRRVNPRFVANLRTPAAAHAMAGDDRAARLVAQDMLLIDPGFRISIFLAWYPLQRACDLDRLREGLRRAGLPE